MTAPAASSHAGNRTQDKPESPSATTASACHIWYCTAVCHQPSASASRCAFIACAPNAPSATARPASNAPATTTLLSIKSLPPVQEHGRHYGPAPGRATRHSRRLGSSDRVDGGLQPFSVDLHGRHANG